MEKEKINTYTGRILLSCFIVFCLLPLALSAQQSNLADLMERARTAGIDETRLAEIQGRAEARGVPEADVAMLLEPAVGLAEQDFPPDYIIQKLMEGFAKGVPANRMAPVVENIRNNTPRAVTLADNWIEKPEVAAFIENTGVNGPQFRNDLVNANIKSLAQQIAPDALEGVLNEIGHESILQKTTPQAVASAINILPDLPASVHRSNAAGSLVLRAIEGGFSASDLQKLPGAMNAAERRSQLPASSVVDGVTRQLGNGIPANQVLQNLFNGNINAGPPGNNPGRPGDNPGRGRGNGGF